MDGVHADDYFYPYDPIISTQDAATFAAYPRGFSNIGDWRRDNVNLLMKLITDSISAIKPYVKFGMSPFGIWKNGSRRGSSALTPTTRSTAMPLPGCTNGPSITSRRSSTGKSVEARITAS